MPVALIEWDKEVKPMFFAGAEAKDICDALAIDRKTVERHINRKGWRQERETLQDRLKPKLEHVTQMSPSVTIASNMVQKHRESYIGSMSRAGAVTAKQFEEEIDKAQTLDAKALLFSSVEPMARVLKPVYGLGNEVPGHNNVQVNVLSGWGETDVVDV